MELKAELNRGNLAKFRMLLRASPTMAAKSLTFVAEKARDDWRAGHSAFVRRNGWLDKGVRIRGATPGNLEARIGSIDAFFGRHVKGIDQPKRGGRGRLFVPAQPIEEQGTHRRIRAMLRRADRHPDRKTFRIMDMIVRRKGKARTPLIVLGRLRKEVTIEPRFDAEAIVGRAVDEHYPTIYARLLAKWQDEQR